MGMMLAPAAFFAALLIGLVALVMDQRFNVPPLAMTVAPIVIMMPGINAGRASSLRVMLFRYWCVGNGIGHGAVFQPTIVRNIGLGLPRRLLDPNQSASRKVASKLVN